ncbi:MAG: DNA repair protein RadC [Bauldia litoralis]
MDRSTGHAGELADAGLPLSARASAPRSPRQREPSAPASQCHGHRDRLRQRFLEGGADALPDYELLEVILFAANPRADVKPMAKALIQHFGGLARVLSATPEALDRTNVKGLGTAGIAAIKAAQAASLRLLSAQAREAPVISNWQALLDYLRAAMAHEPIEQVRILFLDRKNRLIADEIQGRGTVDHTPVYPREVVKRALELGACALILVHNHPSGDPTPSQADIDMTRTVKDAAAPLGVVLHDHLVVGAAETASFRSLGLL